VAGPDTQVYVISECGAGPLQSGININAWLAQERFLVYRSGASRSQSGVTAENNMRNAVAAMRKQVQGVLQKYLPLSMYYMANKYFGSTKALVQSFVVNYGIDWEKTRAFSRGKEGNIFISLKGRDPQGIVMPHEYDDLCKTITDKLYSLTDPATGKPAVDRVYRSDELYPGPSQRIAPDITVAWRNGLYCPHEGKRDDASVFVTRWREYMNWPTSGGHRLDGILFASGPGIRKGHRIEGASILDLAPTWLHAFKQPLPAHLEGSVIDGLFESAE
jgi:predicted AlkP superfamily phosphohydrolase/phosphomutase